MGVKFLTAEWAQAFTDALNGHEAFSNSIGNVQLTLAYKVTDSPEGEVDYHMVLADGSAAVALGETADPDVTITSGHDTAVALQKGELNPQAAFMTGKIRVAGNLALLMMHANVLSNFSTVGQELEVDF